MWPKWQLAEMNASVNQKYHIFLIFNIEKYTSFTVLNFKSKKLRTSSLFLTTSPKFWLKHKNGRKRDAFPTTLSYTFMWNNDTPPYSHYLCFGGIDNGVLIVW